MWKLRCALPPPTGQEYCSQFAQTSNYIYCILKQLDSQNVFPARGYKGNTQLFDHSKPFNTPTHTLAPLTCKTIDIYTKRPCWPWREVPPSWSRSACASQELDASFLCWHSNRGVHRYRYNMHEFQFNVFITRLFLDSYIFNYHQQLTVTPAIVTLAQKRTDVHQLCDLNIMSRLMKRWSDEDVVWWGGGPMWQRKRHGESIIWLAFNMFVKALYVLAL